MLHLRYYTLKHVIKITFVFLKFSRLNSRKIQPLQGLVPMPELRPELLWWRQRVQTTELTENLRHQGILIGVRPPRGPHLSTKIQLYPTAWKLQCWTHQAKHPLRQEYDPTHQKKKKKKKKKWQKKMLQMKEQGKNLQDQINEYEIGNLLWVLFQVDCLFPLHLFALVGFYFTPSSAVYCSVFSFC